MELTLNNEELIRPVSQKLQRKIRILLVNEFFYPENMGGSGTATSDLVAGFMKYEGVEVTAITSRYAYRDPEVRYSPKEAWGSVQIHRVVSPNWGREKKLVKRFVGNLMFSLSAALRAMRLPRPDVVLVLTAPTTSPITGNLIRMFRGVPYVYLVYDLDPDRTVALGFKTESSPSIKVLRKMQRSWLHNSAKVVALGRCMRSLLIENYGLPPEKVTVVEIVAPQSVQPVSRDTEFRRKNGITGPIALYSGNFGRYHDFDTMLEAAKKLQTLRPELTFVMVGGGAKKADVEQFVADNGLKNVKLFPFVPEKDLSDLMGSADVHVVTLDRGMEGIGVPGKFYTCLASGRPVIAIMSADAEVALTVTEENVGFHVNVGDAGALVEILSNTAPQTFADQGVRAREIFEQRFASERLVGRLLTTLADNAKYKD